MNERKTAETQRPRCQIPDTLSGRFQFDTVVHNTRDRGIFSRKRDRFRNGPGCTDSDGIFHPAPYYRDRVPVTAYSVRVRGTVRDFAEIMACRFDYNLSHNNSPVRSPDKQNTADRDTIPPAVTIHHKTTPFTVCLTIYLLSEVRDRDTVSRCPVSISPKISTRHNIKRRGS